MANSMPHPSLPEQRRYWDDRWARTTQPNAWSQRRGEAILAMLDRLVSPSAHILDLGCGTGWFAGRLSSLAHVTAVDLSPTAIAIARARYPDPTFLAGDAFRLPLPRQHFDVVVSQEVIAHVADQRRFVELIAELLKPHGYLVLTTVNKFVIERTEQPPDPPEHIKQWLSLSDLRRLLGSRFRILRTTTVIPMGTRGVLRVVNSPRVSRSLAALISADRLNSLKERAGCGYSRLVLARKRSRSTC